MRKHYLKSGTFSWTFLNDRSKRVTRTKSKLNLKYNGKANGVEVYTIISASGGIVEKTFLSGELFYDTTNKCVSISLATKSIYDKNAYFQISMFLQEYRTPGIYSGAISYTETPSAAQGIPNGQGGYAEFVANFNKGYR